MNLKHVLSSAAVALATLAPIMANASTVFGSAAQLTARDCSQIDARTDCVGAAAPRVQNTFIGGLGSSLDATTTNANGTWAVTTGANPGGLPVLKAGSWSADNTRLNTNAVVFQQFTFTGAAHTQLSLVGDLDFFSTGNDAVSSIDPTGQSNLAEQAGEAGIFATMYFMDPVAFAGRTTAAEIMPLLNMDCSNPYMYAQAGLYLSGALAAGHQTASITLNKDCGGNDIYADPGDTTVLVLAMQTPSNRGGYMDATHTFVSKFDPSLPPETIEALRTGFVSSSPADLPEPTGLALSLAALAALAVARRRAG
jgi:hypothetical protein